MQHLPTERVAQEKRALCGVSQADPRSAEAAARRRRRRAAVSTGCCDRQKRRWCSCSSCFSRFSAVSSNNCDSDFVTAEIISPSNRTSCREGCRKSFWRCCGSWWIEVKTQLYHVCVFFNCLLSHSRVFGVIFTFYFLQVLVGVMKWRKKGEVKERERDLWKSRKNTQNERRNQILLFSLCV